MKAKLCDVFGCLGVSYIRGYCQKHYAQIQRLGYIKSRTKADPNEFTVEEEVCKIHLYNIKDEKIAEALIDIEDMERCKNHKWCVGPKGYVWSNSAKFLAPFIFGRKSIKGFDLDHFDGDKFNNRRNNIQEITHQQNGWKRRMCKNNTSGYRGVSWNKGKGKWVASIGHNGKLNHLGFFQSKEAAAYAYNEMASKLFGEFAVLNKVFQSEEISEPDCSKTKEGNNIIK